MKADIKYSVIWNTNYMLATCSTVYGTIIMDFHEKTITRKRFTSRLGAYKTWKLCYRQDYHMKKFNFPLKIVEHVFFGFFNIDMIWIEVQTDNDWTMK